MKVMWHNKIVLKKTICIRMSGVEKQRNRSTGGLFTSLRRNHRSLRSVAVA